jgi:hypothetical protein
LAEVGCSEKQIAAVTGHTTLKELARHTRAANQERLAADAVLKLAKLHNLTTIEQEVSAQDRATAA